MGREASPPTDSHSLLLELAHDLQTPLTVLKCRVARLRATMVRDAPDDSEAAQIDALIDSISAGIAEFIVSASCPAGEPAFTILSFSDLVNELLEEVAVVAEARGIGVSTRIDSGISLSGNRRCLREAVQNLLANALKYIGDGSCKEIRATLERSGRSAVLTIADTGMGISENDLPHIFKRRYRGEQRYGLAPGLGLGLSIVERAVQTHHGSIEVTSAVGVGTTFVLRFPCMNGTDAA